MAAKAEQEWHHPGMLALQNPKRAEISATFSHKKNSINLKLNEAYWNKD